MSRGTYLILPSNLEIIILITLRAFHNEWLMQNSTLKCNFRHKAIITWWNPLTQLFACLFLSQNLPKYLLCMLWLYGCNYVIVVTQVRKHCLTCLHDRQCTSAYVANNMLHLRHSKYPPKLVTNNSAYLYTKGSSLWLLPGD